MKKPEE